ncbi:hypothetical protein LTR09_008445 [Extremus antarcticus]|uniref:Uncharacterized protein n=1 Tax=Extremus antarcticus TaxID=702011 RepID=A0AAJ0DHK0_9PEZI|nr:hypothetical protein LTR09_008445 [Extremus antarcticus]
MSETNRSALGKDDCTPADRIHLLKSFMNAHKQTSKKGTFVDFWSWMHGLLKEEFPEEAKAVDDHLEEVLEEEATAGSDEGSA